MPGNWQPHPERRAELGRLGRLTAPVAHNAPHATSIGAYQFRNFGRTGAKAMACGAVVVLTDSGGSRDYCVYDNNSLFVPVDNPDAIVTAIERLTGDPVPRQTLHVSGLATMRRFDDRIPVRDLLAVCHKSTQTAVA